MKKRVRKPVRSTLVLGKWGQLLLGGLRWYLY